MNDRQIIDTAVASDLGDNANRLHELIQTKKKSVFVDIGVRAGMSSGIMGLRSKENGNKVYGVDVSWNNLNVVAARPQKIPLKLDQSLDSYYPRAGSWVKQHTLCRWIFSAFSEIVDLGLGGGSRAVPWVLGPYT